MAKHIQIGIKIDTDGDPNYEVNVTPVDTAIPANIANSLEPAIHFLDMNDEIPNSGKLERKVKLDIPIRIFGMTFRVKYPALITLDIVDK